MPRRRGSWRLKLEPQPSPRSRGLEPLAYAPGNNLLQALRRHRWLKVNTPRLEAWRRWRREYRRTHSNSKRRRMRRNRPSRALDTETLRAAHYLLPRQRWLQRHSLRTLRHPRRRTPAITVPLTATLRYARARKRLYQYLLQGWESNTNYSRARVAMKDFLGELGSEEPANFPWN